MGVLAMLAETLAVIRQHGDQRLIRRPPANSVKEPAKLVVGIGDLSVIQALFVLLPIRRRRLVRRVRIVNMDPKEKRLAGLSFQPKEGMVDGVSRRGAAR